MEANKHYFFSVVFFLIATFSYAQNIVSGVVYDNETKQPLPGANVVIKGTTQGASTNIDGEFSLKTNQSKGTILVSYVSFENKEVPFAVSNGKVSVKVYLNPDAQALDEVVVTGSSLLDIAKERQTPVAVSTVKSAEIIEKLGSKELPEILNRTPSVYATKAGGGYGDSKINIRGFANENIAVMVNGMPVNDMEGGRVYWSNWAGLSDVTSAMQVQRGLGASKLAIASVGGTINIVTKSSDMKEGGVVSASYGSTNEYKALAAYNTGKSKKGWSSSILLSRAWGQKYPDGTSFEGYNYYFALGYAPSEKHGFQFMVTGAPQWHNQRSFQISIADYIKYGGSKDKPNRKYNSDWGYLDGEEFAARRNAYHKPVAMFNWDWNITNASQLSSVIYGSLGRGFGTADLGRVNGKSLRGFRNAEGLYDFDRVIQENQTTATPLTAGRLIRRASINSHDWYGFLTNFSHKIDKNFTASIGLDGRYYYGYHYQLITDLLGASGYNDTANKNLAGPNVVTATIDADPIYNPFKKIDPIENRIGYSNDGEVRWFGMFAQFEYSDERFSAFLQGSSSIQGFQRIDEFVRPGTLAIATDPTTGMERKTGFKDIPGFNVKTGLNYNINENHNVFANVGYYSKQPFFNAVYPNNKNFLNPNLTNEKILGVEAGYGFKSSAANVHLNVYRTSWKDRNLVKRNIVLTDVTSGTTTNAYANILGVTEIHQGVELETDVRVTDYLRLKGALSIGDWFYEGNATGNLFNESNQPVDANGVVVPAGGGADYTLYLEDVKVGDSAQLLGSLGLSVTPIEGLRFDADWRYVGNLYANLNVTDFDTQAKAEKGSLKLPSYNLFDISLSYKFKLTEKQTLTLSGHIDNLLDTYYILESYTNTHQKTLSDFAGNQANYQNYLDNNLYKGIDDRNQVFFGNGRTFSVSLRYAF